MPESKIITETAEYFVINKPAGVAAEPPSHAATLQDWLFENKHIDPNGWLEDERYGVVHRLDTDTSGIVIWAKNKEAQDKLKLLWQGRQVQKTYLALLAGECDETGEIDLAIARDNKNDRQKVVWIQDGQARPAITRYRRLSTGKVGDRTVSLVEAHPVTGRTHQIRVHFKAIDHPLTGDKLYGEKSSTEIAEKLGLKRHFLHASKICLPTEKEKICYEAPLAEDLAAALKQANISI